MKLTIQCFSCTRLGNAVLATESTSATQTQIHLSDDEKKVLDLVNRYQELNPSDRKVNKPQNTDDANAIKVNTASISAEGAELEAIFACLAESVDLTRLVVLKLLDFHYENVPDEADLTDLAKNDEVFDPNLQASGSFASGQAVMGNVVLDYEIFDPVDPMLQVASGRFLL